MPGNIGSHNAIRGPKYEGWNINMASLRIRMKNNRQIMPDRTQAPMAVLPGFKKKGIRRKLILAGFEVAKTLGFKSVMVLCHKDYCPESGFVPVSAWHIKAPFQAPDEAFMATGLVKDVSGIVD